MAKGKPVNRFGEYPLSQRVLAFVEERGEVTSSEVLAAVGRYVSAAQAVRRGRSYLKARNAPGKKWHIRPDSPMHRISIAEKIGRRICVTQCLRGLCDEGKIRRVGVGRYARLTPRLYEETG